MKKITAAVSAALLAMGMCMSASAAGTTGTITGASTDGVNITWTQDENPSSIEIKGTVVRNDVYNIKLDWGSMEFTYDAGTWNTETHAWDNGGWKEEEFDTVNNKLSLTNNSSQPVFANLATTVSHANIQGNTTDPVTMTLFRKQTYDALAAAGAKAVFEDSIADVKADVYDKDTANQIYINGGEGAAGNGITRDLFLQIQGTPLSKARLNQATIGSITVTLTSAAVTTP